MGLSEKVYCITKQQETEINQNEMKNDNKTIAKTQKGSEMSCRRTTRRSKNYKKHRLQIKTK